MSSSSDTNYDTISLIYPYMPPRGRSLKSMLAGCDYPKGMRWDITWEVLLCVGEENEPLLDPIIQIQQYHILSQK